MTFGLSTLGSMHVAFSLFALAAGLVVVAGLLAERSIPVWTALYVASGLAAAVTGFGLPVTAAVPRYLGILVLALLLTTAIARCVFRRAGPWHRIHAVAAVLSVHVFVFFAIGEAFLRISILNGLSPTLTELPF